MLRMVRILGGEDDVRDGYSLLKSVEFGVTELQMESLVKAGFTDQFARLEYQAKK